MALSGTSLWQVKVINAGEKSERRAHFGTIAYVGTLFAQQAHAVELHKKVVGTYAGTAFDAYVCAFLGDAPKGVDAEIHLGRLYGRVKYRKDFNAFVKQTMFGQVNPKGWSLRQRQRHIRQFKSLVKEKFHLLNREFFTDTCPIQLKCILSGNKEEISFFCETFVNFMMDQHGKEAESTAIEAISNEMEERCEDLAVCERRLVMLWLRRRFWHRKAGGRWPMPPRPLSKEAKAANKLAEAMATGADEVTNKVAAPVCGAAAAAAAAACRADAVRAAPATPTQEAARAARAAPATPTQEAAPEGTPVPRQSPAPAVALAGATPLDIVEPVRNPDAPQSPPPPPKKLGPDVTQLSPRQAPTGTTEPPLQDVSSPPAARVKRRDRKALHVRVGPNSPVRRQGRREPRGQGAATRRGHFDLPPPSATTFPEPAPEAPNGGAPLGANTELGDALNRADCAERRAADAKARVNGLIAQLAEVVGLRDAADERAAMAKEDCDLSKTRAEALAVDIAAAEARADEAEARAEKAEARAAAAEKQASRLEREKVALHAAWDAAEARVRELEEQLKDRADRALSDDTE